MAEVQDFLQQVQCIPEMYIWEIVKIQLINVLLDDMQRSFSAHDVMVTNLGRICGPRGSLWLGYVKLKSTVERP